MSNQSSLLFDFTSNRVPFPKQIKLINTHSCKNHPQFYDLTPKIIGWQYFATTFWTTLLFQKGTALIETAIFSWVLILENVLE